MPIHTFTSNDITIRCYAIIKATGSITYIHAKCIHFTCSFYLQFSESQSEIAEYELVQERAYCISYRAVDKRKT